MDAGTPKRARFGWMLFDWASQPYHTLLITFIFAPYFTSAVAADPASGQATWGYMTAAAGIVIALMAPVLGAMADTSGPRKPWIALFSVAYVTGAALLWLAVPGMSDPTIVLLAFALGLIGVEFATTFTNAMLPDLVPRAQVGRLSGSGWALGYVGGLVSLILMLTLLAENEAGVTLIGQAPILGLDPEMREGTRSAGPLTAIWYVIFMIPFFLWVPDAPRRASTAGAVRAGLADLARTVKALPQNGSLMAYLGSSMFYRDALNGLYAFGGIYAAGVLGWSIVDIGIFGILAAATGAVGAWVGGFADERFGPKPLIATCITALALICLIIVMTSRDSVLGMPVAAGSALPDITFYVCGALIGAAGGALQAASRTLLVDQAEAGRMTQTFGLYALVGKATAFLAPLSIALATDLSGSQRVGVSPVIALFLLGLVLLFWVHPKHKPA
ncbi:MFS transporter [Oceanomicrobium pacificus]|uniref:MFS transporter n=1 Tax=Oceanomicrobium pacificus TaxID=2692916 RepID=A0A6B0TYT4_9RHOB|nr:MFS transporter [Oceanomicrobium pacificus]MXU64061.1 MFS transporter [Oceanomicrobium pacificus]